MEIKKGKKSSNSKKQFKSIRLSAETIKKAAPFIEMANRENELSNTKKKRRKIKIDQILQIGLELITEDHIKVLQRKCLTNSDRQEILWKKYCEVYGTVSIEEYIGFTQTLAYADFLKEYIDLLKVS